MSITSYTLLKSTLADWVMRDDLTSVIPTFIQMYESSVRRDPRYRNLTYTTLSVSTAQTDLPTDFLYMESLAHTGPTYFGELSVVSPGESSETEKQYAGSTGVPETYFITGNLNEGFKLNVSPSPSEAFTLDFSYWATIERLSDSVQTNWLLTEHPDIYTYGSLVEMAPYIEDDERVALWRSELERRIQELWQSVERAQFSGKLVRRPGDGQNIP